MLNQITDITSSTMMLVWGLFTGVLEMLGFWKKSGKVLFLGLDNAGKTTLLHLLKEDRLVQHNPTLQVTSEEVSIGKMSFTALDLGGHQAARRLWKDYSNGVNAIVFFVDVCDLMRFEESRHELWSLLLEQQLADCPILILGNKIDRSDPVNSEEFILRYFQLHHLTTGKGDISRSELENRRPLEFFMCSVLRRQGYIEGFRWLSQYM